MKLSSSLLFAAVLWSLTACSSSAPLDGAQTNNVAMTGAATAKPTSQQEPTTTRAAATPTAQAQQTSSTATTQPTAQPTTAQPTPTSAQTQSAPTSQPAPTLGSEIVFLRGGTLVAYDVMAQSERQVADNVRTFVATPDGRMLALVRGAGVASELWLVNRDGSGLRQLTTNQRAEDTPAFAPDGQALVFAAGPADLQAGHTWLDWSRWCLQSEVVLLTIANGQEQSFGPGCDPAFSPDGKRIAFATAPTRVEDSSAPDGPLAYNNAIRLINRQGQNGWNFATAGDPAKPTTGRLVFAPAWSPDGRQIAYQRFVGYQALTDVLYTEIGRSFEGKGKQIDFGAGWLLAPRFAPSNGQIAIIDNNAGDARGWGGYEQWSVRVIRAEGQRQMALPQGATNLGSTMVGTLARAQQVAWSPDGATLAVQLPSGWQPNAAENEPLFTQETSGEVWRWQPGQPPSQKLISNVDFASSLVWLPAVQ